MCPLHADPLHADLPHADPFQRQTPSLQMQTPFQRQIPLPPKAEQTNTCENITFPILRMQSVIIIVYVDDWTIKKAIIASNDLS